MRIETSINSTRPIETTRPEAKDATSLRTLDSAGKSFMQNFNEAVTASETHKEHTKSAKNVSLRSFLLDRANNDQQEAARLAHSYAYNSLNGEMHDLTDYPIIRYSATGEIVNDETTLYFAKNMSSMQKQRTHLYESEIEKGTPSVRILEKILDFNDGLPQKFREMANW